MADKTDDLIISISTDLATVRRSLKKLESDIGGTADKVNRRFYTMGQQIDRAFAGVGQNVLRNLTGPLAGVAAVLSTREVLSYADAWTKAKNSLAVAGVVGAEQANVLERLYQSAQANAAPLGALAGLFGKAAQASDSLGASQEELLKFSDGVAVALRVAGTSATEAGGALTQLGQLLGSARVQAEEFNSVNEGARPILIAVAKGLDEAGGSVNKLKQLVNDGKVSGQQFFQAFLKGLPAIQAMAAGAAQTIEQGFTKVGNALTKYIGQTDESLSASQRLVAGLNALADNFGTVADVTLNLASIIAAAFLGRAIGPMIARLATTSTGLVATAVAMRGFEASILRAVVALRAGQIAAAGFKGALGFAGGSVGLAITALAVAFGYAATRTDEASRTADRYAEILKRVRDSADDAGGAAKGAGDSFVQAERNRLGKLVEEEAQSARNAAAEFEAAIDRWRSASLPT